MARENPDRTLGALRVAYDADARRFDLVLDAAAQRFETDDGLETAVALSLFTDRRASEADLRRVGLPRESNAGWPGDTYAEVPGDESGSHLWLLKRALRDDETLQLAEQYAQEALQWLIDDGVALSVDVVASWIGDTDFLEIEIVIERPSIDEPRWRRAWNATTGELLT